MKKSLAKYLICLATAMILILSISVSISAQDNIDIKGWNNTYWGMTENDLKDLFKGEIINTEKQIFDKEKIYRNLKIEKYEIGGINFTVFFEMGVADNKLRSVQLMDRGALLSYFSQFEQLLTGKYGQPKSNNESQSHIGFDKTAAWLLPSTKIELSYHSTPALGSVLNIIYSDQNILKEATDKLK